MTSIVESVILILEEEKRAGNITENQERDILDLFRRASKQLFKNHPRYHREVMNMTEPKIKTLSMQLEELKAERDVAVAERDIVLAEKDKEIAALTKEKDAEITALKKKLAALSS